MQRIQVRCHESKVEGLNHLPPSAGHPAFDEAQDSLGFLGCKHIMRVHMQFFSQQYPQVFLGRAALNSFIPQPVLISGIASTLVHSHALGFVQLHEVSAGPLLKPVKVPL